MVQILPQLVSNAVELGHDGVYRGTTRRVHHQTCAWERGREGRKGGKGEGRVIGEKGRVGGGMEIEVGRREGRWVGGEGKREGGRRRERLVS